MSCLKILNHFETQTIVKASFSCIFLLIFVFYHMRYSIIHFVDSDSSSIPLILHLVWCMATWHQVVKIGCFRDDKQLFHETIKLWVESGKSNAKNHPH